MSHQSIGITELIEKIKADLLKPTQTSNPLFSIDEVELEISFTVERSAQGGINIYVLESGVEKTWGEAQTVRVKMKGLANETAKQALVRSTNVD